MITLGCDSSGNVLLITESLDGSGMIDSLNGITITSYILTDSQITNYNQLPLNSGIIFDGQNFTTLPFVPLEIDPQPTIQDLITVLQANGIDISIDQVTQQTQNRLANKGQLNGS